MITQRTQIVQYLGPDVIDISELSNLQYVDRIYYIDENNNYIGWLSETPYNFLQGMTNLSPESYYLIVSKSSAVYPYDLFLDYPTLATRMVVAESEINSLQVTTENNRIYTEAVYSDLLNRNSINKNLIDIVSGTLVSTSGILHNADVANSGFFTNELSAMSGALRTQYLASDIAFYNDLYDQIIETSGALSGIFNERFTDLVGSAPATLDTLKEIADALNNNPNIADLVDDINDATIVNRNNLITASGTLRDALIASSGALRDALIAASGHLFEIATENPRYVFNVVPNNANPELADAYRFSGVGINAENQDDPTIYLRRGETYAFIVNTPHHPFYIKTEPVVGSESMYNNGVQNNGYTDRTVIFEVPYNAPNLLYYQCSNHLSMGGKLYTVQPSYQEVVDGGLHDTFEPFGTTVPPVTTVPPTTTSPPTTFDTTYTIASGQNVIGQPGGGLTFYAVAGSSIEFNIQSPIANPLAVTSLYLYVNNAFVSRLDITTEYRNSGETFKVTLNSIEYTVAFSAGTPISNYFRVDL